MSQKSPVPQAISFVSQVLKRDSSARWFSLRGVEEGLNSFMLEAAQHPFYQSEKSVSQKDGLHDGDGTCEHMSSMTRS